MNKDVTAKIAMMEGSLRCFTFGLLGFLPVIGLPFALIAVWSSGRARMREKQFWNPAKPYRICGIVCGTIGALVWGGIYTLIIGRLAWYAYVGN
jgi:hypothetical protein